jgi:3-isopropylmalate/(R)-2-methylmalate dehydratase small subunit
MSQPKQSLEQREPVREIRGVAVPFGYSSVDTDAIFPVSGEAIADEHGFGAALFARWRSDPGFILNREIFQGASILVADADFGIGSSRETAVWALRGAGFRAILAPSFGDIFRSNCVRNGVLTAVITETVRERLHGYLEAAPGAELTVDLIACTVTAAGGAATDGTAADGTAADGTAPDSSFSEPVRIDGFARRCLVDGIDEFDLLAGYRQRTDQVLNATGPWVPDTRRLAQDHPRQAADDRSSRTGAADDRSSR